MNEGLFRALICVIKLMYFLFLQLAKQCDVIVENYIPGKLDQYNLGYKHLSVVAPQLIYCSITGRLQLYRIF